MSRFIAIANQKGGVGKTTTTVNLAASLAQLGRRVLVLDMDPQGNASSGFGISANSLQRGVYEVLMGTSPVQEAIYRQASPGVDLLPSGQRLIGAEVELVSALARERILEKGIQSIRNQYDILLADCPPSLGLLTVNTLTAADSVLIPIQCEYYALEGVTQLMNAIRLIQQALNPRLDVEGILLTMFDARLNLSREVMEEARKFFSGKVYETVIPRNVRLSEAPSFGKPVLLYDPECAGAQFYLKLAREVLRLPPDGDASEIEETKEVAAPEAVEVEAVASHVPTAAPHIPSDASIHQAGADEIAVEPVAATGIETAAAPAETTAVETATETIETTVEPVAEPVEAAAAETASEPAEAAAVETASEPVEAAAVETASEPVEAAAADIVNQPIEATAIEPAETTAFYTAPSITVTAEPDTPYAHTIIESQPAPALEASETSVPTESQTEASIPEPAPEPSQPTHSSFDAIVAAYNEDVTVIRAETDITTDEIIVLSEDAIVPSSEPNETISESNIEQPIEPLSEPRAIEDERPAGEPTTEAHPQEELVSHD